MGRVRTRWVGPEGERGKQEGTKGNRRGGGRSRWVKEAGVEEAGVDRYRYGAAGEHVGNEEGKLAPSSCRMARV